MSIPFKNKSTLWVIHIGNSEKIALRARDEGFVCIGWTALGDLSQFKTRDKMRKAMGQAYPKASSGTIRSTYGQVFRFAHEMVIGDPVVFPIKPTSEIAIGKVIGDYTFNTKDKELIAEECNNIRSIEWLKIVPRTVFSKTALHSFGSFSTVSTSNDHLEEVIGVAIAESSDEPTEEIDKIYAESVDEDETSGMSLSEQASQETEDYLLKAWRNTGAAFEHLVAAVFRALGYTSEVTPASGDHGIDVIAHPDPLGLKTPYIKVQVKSGSSAIGEPDVNQLKGAVLDSEKGILISLGRFTSGAQAAARGMANITLIDAKRFVPLFLDHYEQLEPIWQAKFPLKKTLVPIN